QPRHRRGPLYFALRSSRAICGLTRRILCLEYPCLDLRDGIRTDDTAHDVHRCGNDARVEPCPERTTDHHEHTTAKHNQATATACGCFTRQRSACPCDQRPMMYSHR